MAIVPGAFNHFLRGLARRYHLRSAASGPACPPGSSGQRVLVLGIYLADRANTASHLAREFAASSRHSVTQRWMALNGEPDSVELAAVTVGRQDGFHPKFSLLNGMLREVPWTEFDWILVSDDDIVVARGFLDAYLGYQSQYHFALAQPARTRWSYADHKFTRRAAGMNARETRFVEIGPLFSVDRQFARLAFPFDESSPMGWGFDFAWPVLAQSNALSIGIIDATPVDHSLRKQAVTYDSHKASADMLRYFESHPHLTRREAFTVLKQYPCSGLAHDDKH